MYPSVILKSQIWYTHLSLSSVCYVYLPLQYDDFMGIEGSRYYSCIHHLKQSLNTSDKCQSYCIKNLSFVIFRLQCQLQRTYREPRWPVRPACPAHPKRLSKCTQTTSSTGQRCWQVSFRQRPRTIMSFHINRSKCGDFDVPTWFHSVTVMFFAVLTIIAYNKLHLWASVGPCRVHSTVELTLMKNDWGIMELGWRLAMSEANSDWQYTRSLLWYSLGATQNAKTASSRAISDML